MGHKRFDPEKTWVGITPTSWWNDDFLDIDIGITFGQCISEMALAGYAGCSVGHKYPTDPDVLLAELGQRKLRVSEPWTSTYFTVNDMHDKTVANFCSSMQFIKAMGGTDLVVAEIGGSSHPLPIDLFANRRVFDDIHWKLLADGLNEIGKIAHDAGMTLCYHHHMGTGVMTRADIDKLACLTDPDLVHFLFDTGHLYFAGDDPLSMVHAYAKRIKHVHLKNIRKPIMEQVKPKGMSFKDAIQAGIFTVPGDPKGCIEFEPILGVLSDNDFTGWLIVEAEQNPAHATPLKYATMAREYLRNKIRI
jgi:inosose dehydratase